ncbi:zinc finger CCCH domain-containing protein 67 [Forsythia ovata]|uniref:Zinc finger CCCH domain-containing protein 67 n=1 Tax=Forsythia ovata TaxID=205694 RepID=A0ABD1P6K5_9LAMI
MSSSTLTSEKPTNQYQTQKLGLGVLIPERTLSDCDKKNGPAEIQDFERCAVEEAKGNAIVKAEEVEVEELRNAIEKEIHQLTSEQAEIEAACRRPFEFDDDRENEMDLRIGENVNLEEEKIGEDVGNVEEENENEGDGWKRIEDSEEENENGNEEGEAPGGEFGVMVMKNGGYDSINNGRKKLSPMRPNAEDCTYYMKTGSCRYGFSCKFNHPPRRNNQGVMERSIKREENPDNPKQTKVVRQQDLCTVARKKLIIPDSGVELSRPANATGITLFILFKYSS